MYIGLDLGTSGLKGIVIDDAQTICAEATAPLQVTRPKAGWSEQAPQDWLEAAEAVLSSLAAQADLSAVRAIGLSVTCMGRRCWMTKIGWCAPVFCGTTPALRLRLT